eukprot:1374429-Amorphochlora_amoeboformis.AAC.1
MNHVKDCLTEIRVRRSVVERHVAYKAKYEPCSDLHSELFLVRLVENCVSQLVRHTPSALDIRDGWNARAWGRLEAEFQHVINGDLSVTTSPTFAFLPSKPVLALELLVDVVSGGKAGQSGQLRDEANALYVRKIAGLQDGAKLHRAALHHDGRLRALVELKHELENIKVGVREETCEARTGALHVCQEVVRKVLKA